MWMRGWPGGLDGNAERLRAPSAPRADGVPPVRGARYVLRQRTVDRPLDFFVEDEGGEGVVRVTGALPHPRECLVFQDARGRELYRTARPAGPLLAAMELRRPDGSTAAVVHNALLSPVRDRWRIDVPGEGGMVATGSVLQHEYTLRRGDTVVASVSKGGVHRRDAYGVTVAGGADAPLVLAVAVVVELLSHRVQPATPPGEGH